MLISLAIASAVLGAVEWRGALQFGNKRPASAGSWATRAMASARARERANQWTVASLASAPAEPSLGAHASVLQIAQVASRLPLPRRHRTGRSGSAAGRRQRSSGTGAKGVPLTTPCHQPRMLRMRPARAVPNKVPISLYLPDLQCLCACACASWLISESSE